MSRGRGRGRGRGAGGAAGAAGSSAFAGGLLLEVAGVELFPTAPIEDYPSNIRLIPPKPPKPQEREALKLHLQYLKALKGSPFYLTAKPPSPDLRKDIKRYSDKYLSQSSKQIPKLEQVCSDVSIFPEELHGVINPTLKKEQKKKSTSTATGKHQNPLQVLDELRIDGEENEEKKDKETKEEGESDNEEMQEDEEEEDANDYVENYFDNGEGDDYDEDDAGGGGGGGGEDYY